MKLPLSRIAEFIQAAGAFDPKAVAQGYSIDSRTVLPGELFFAVKGERLDGHDYVGAALERGARAAVVSRERAGGYRAQERLLVVDDTLAALQKLAMAARKLWAALPLPAKSGGSAKLRRVIAVTGSAGKTTTKEAIAAILSRKLPLLKSQGNLNNHFGLPLQLLKLEPEHEMAVMELGMNHAGEIAALARIAQPDVGVVTCVAPVHLGFFSSVAEIAKAKYELIQALPAHGVAVLNADDEYVSQFGRDFPGKTVTVGLQHPADVRGEGVEQHGAWGSVFELVAGDERAAARLPLVGRHNVYNALAAVAVALVAGLRLGEAVAELERLRPADKRGEVVELGGMLIVNDCYNSNPKALDSMVEAMAGMTASGGLPARRIVVAGEMLELGPAAEELHRRCGRHMAERKIDILLGVRGEARHMVEAARDAGMRAEYVETPELAGEWLARETRPGDVVLLKASRGVRLERAWETWKAGLEADRGSR